MEQVHRGMAWVYKQYAPLGSPLYEAQGLMRGCASSVYGPGGALGMAREAPDAIRGSNSKVACSKAVPREGGRRRIGHHLKPR